MRFYSISPQAVGTARGYDVREELAKDGGNAAAVLEYLKTLYPDQYRRVLKLLRQVVSDLEEVRTEPFGSILGLRFIHSEGADAKGSPRTFTLDAFLESDGTLRMLGILTAAALAESAGSSVLGIEEPESAVHVGAFGTLLDALRSTARHTQVLITTHSADLLDGRYIRPDNLRIVERTPLGTVVGPMQERAAEAVRKHLLLPGDLVRSGGMDQPMAMTPRGEIDLFGEVPDEESLQW